MPFRRAPPRDQERRPTLVDDNVVYFVDNGEVKRALDSRFLKTADSVPQAVEPELNIRAIGNVTFVGAPGVPFSVLIGQRPNRYPE